MTTQENNQQPITKDEASLGTVEKDQLKGERIKFVKNVIGQAVGGWKQAGIALAMTLRHYLHNSNDSSLVAMLQVGLDQQGAHKGQAKIIKSIAKEYFAISGFTVDDTNKQPKAKTDKVEFAKISRDKQLEVIEKLETAGLAAFIPEKGQAKKPDQTFVFSKDAKSFPAVIHAANLAHKIWEIKEKTGNAVDPTIDMLDELLRDAIKEADKYIASMQGIGNVMQNVQDKDEEQSDEQSGEQEQELPAVSNG